MGENDDKKVELQKKSYFKNGNPFIIGLSILIIEIIIGFLIGRDLSHSDSFIAIALGLIITGVVYGWFYMKFIPILPLIISMAVLTIGKGIVLGRDVLYELEVEATYFLIMGVIFFIITLVFGEIFKNLANRKK